MLWFCSCLLTFSRTYVLLWRSFVFWFVLLWSNWELCCYVCFCLFLSSQLFSVGILGFDLYVFKQQLWWWFCRFIKALGPCCPCLIMTVGQGSMLKGTPGPFVLFSVFINCLDWLVIAFLCFCLTRWSFFFFSVALVGINCFLCLFNCFVWRVAWLCFSLIWLIERLFIFKTCQCFRFLIWFSCLETEPCVCSLKALAQGHVKYFGN